jgi:hypothetical protein
MHDIENRAHPGLQQIKRGAAMLGPDGVAVCALAYRPSSRRHCTTWFPTTATSGFLPIPQHPNLSTIGAVALEIFDAQQFRLSDFDKFGIAKNIAADEIVVSVIRQLKNQQKLIKHNHNAIQANKRCRN